MKIYTNTGNKDTRSGFGAGLTELGKTNDKVVALCADLIGSLKMDDFKKNHPERFFQFLLQELLPIFRQVVFMIRFVKVLPIQIKM